MTDLPNREHDLQGIPLPAGDWLYGERFLMALRIAAQLHATQTRKGTQIPYVSHLLGACAIALEHGADEDEAIAALLHDSIEDVEPTDEVRATVAWFGPWVLAIVEGCTDADVHPKPPWRARKEAYLRHLASADASTVLVSASDKLHNARTIVSDLHAVGPAVWDRFNASRVETLWYYGALVNAYRANGRAPLALVDELERTVRELAQGA
jgi:(p)ppGpp synthase/HD superfamily hydrolase